MEKVGVKRIRLTFYPSKDLSRRVSSIGYSIDNLPKTEEENNEETTNPTPGDGGTEMD
jgi:hypothetical protein